MNEYIEIVAKGMDKVRDIATNSQQDILNQLGVSEVSFMKYQNQLGMFMQELMMKQQAGGPEQKELTLAEVKYAMRLQVEYIRAHGSELLDRLIEATRDWPVQKKSELPLYLSVVIADGAFEEHPEIDEEAIQQAESRCLYIQCNCNSTSLPK